MIPKQLKDMAFCRVMFKDKKPFEKNWQVLGHTYEQIQEYFPKENYGVLTGVNNLGVLDDDSEDKRLIKLFEDNFGDTFKVREHEYIILKGWDGKKIIFFDGDIHLGELQGLGQQVVGPGSIHPSGEEYKLVKDIPLKEIEFLEFTKVFDKYIRKVKKSEPIIRNTSFSGDNINDISITDIFSVAGFADKGGGCYQGEHPIHGSLHGCNFFINTMENIWCCYRCNNSGGGIWTAIAVNEGIVDCSDCVKGFTLSEDQRKKVIQVAWDKYGLKKPEQDLSKLEPMGWANSINIKKMAERMELTNCPNCNIPFEFNERMGWYKCKCCGIKGGIRKLLNFKK